MRAVSPKRAAENRIREKVLAEMRGAEPWCHRCGKTTDPLDGHELLSRARGGSITDPDNIVLLGRGCHRWVTENPRAAADEGWVLSRFSGRRRVGGRTAG